jgi:NAD(P)-dependent dehydrogenase (short-subunit alcohol dehydrogenase family)
MMEQSIGNNKQMREALVALHPIGRPGKPEEIANAVIWLLSDKASFLTGHTLLVDGGLADKMTEQFDFKTMSMSIDEKTVGQIMNC